MDKQLLDRNLAGLSTELRALQWERAPELALRTCVAEVNTLVVDAPPELHGYLVDRLEPVLSEYGIDASRLLGPMQPRPPRGERDH